MVSISGCDPLDPGSNPGTAKLFVICCVIFNLLVLLSQETKRNKEKNRMTSEGIEPPIFGSGIRRVAIAPRSRS